MRATYRPIVLLCLVLLSLIAGATGRFLWSRRHRQLLGELAQAIGSDLDIEARVTGGFPPPAAGAARRSATPASDRLSPDARIAIARLEKQAWGDRNPSALAALGVAQLVEGEVDRSIATLEDVTSLTEDASAWSDLSAAYLVKAERLPARKVEYLGRALDTASRSLRDGPTNEARFNRSLALERLAPYVEARAPWDEYLRTERDPRWAAVARRHAATRTKTSDARISWEERRNLLTARLDAHDRPFIVDTATRFPEASLEFFEQEVLSPWARAESSGDRHGAAVGLVRAEELADAWFAATRDPMLQEIARQIKALSGSANGVQLLARAHLAYLDAVTKYRADDYAGATAAVDAALAGFRRAETPFWTWAALQKATILFQLRQLDQSDAELAPVEALARRRGYPTLLGRALRQRGLTQSKQWRLAEALAAFEESARCFETAGEREDAVAVDSLIAANLRMLGEHHASWEYIGRTLDGLGHVRTPLRRYLVMYNASLFASSQELLETALLFQNAAVREARIRGRGPVIEALTERASIRVRRGEYGSALDDLSEALSAVDSVPEGALKRGAKAEIEILIAELNQSQHQPPKIEELKEAVQFFATIEPSLVPRLYLGLARAHLAAGSTGAAEEVFGEGIAQLEGQDARLGDDAFKISYFDESWNLFPEMVAFQLNVRHDVTKAFEYAERSRARSLAGVGHPVGLPEIQQAIPRSIALIYYVTLPDRVLIWTVTNVAVVLSETRIEREEIARLVSRHVALVQDNHLTDAALDARLYNALVRPIADAAADRTTLVLIPDGDLQRLSFATLRNPRTQRFLIEDHAILVSPSATVFAAGLARLHIRSGQSIDSALLVGNPIAAGDSSRDLKPLPGSEGEAVAAARFYPRHEVLTGRAATKTRFVEAAGSYDVVHFGGHAIVNAEYPLLSRLSFSPDRDGGPSQSLFAHEISHLPFRRTRLVVLAACSTGVGAVSRGEGVVSIARPFLAAGVPMVVASQWDVDDRATEELFLAFHRAMSERQDPVKALRSAQLSLLRSRNATLALPRNWGAFVVLGTSAQ
jgi:CHAT domain-containing protein